MHEKRGDIVGIGPLRWIRIRHRFAVGRRIHRPRQQDVRGDGVCDVLARDGLHKRDERRFRCGVDTEHRLRIDRGSRADREEGASLSKLALSELLTGPEHWADEFMGALKGLDMEALRQREAELNARAREIGMSALSADEKNELRSLQPSIRRLEAELKAIGSD